MHWHVLSTDGADYNLLTSDRPIIMTNGILRPDGHIALPIGPRKLFLAAQDIETIDKIIHRPINAIVSDSNAHVTEYAHRYVYSNDDGQIRFIENRMSTKSRPRLVETYSQKHLTKNSTDN